MSTLFLVFIILCFIVGVFVAHKVILDYRKTSYFPEFLKDNIENICALIIIVFNALSPWIGFHAFFSWCLICFMWGNTVNSLLEDSCKEKAIKEEEEREKALDTFR